MSNNLVSGILSRAGLTPGMTENLHLAILPAYLNLAVHMPNCLIFDSLYVFSTTELFFFFFFLVACKASIVD